MPRTEFLVRVANIPPVSIRQALDELHDASVLFVAGWSAKDLDRAGRASKNAIPLFDFIISSLLRERDDLKSGAKAPANPAYLKALNQVAGWMVKPVTRADQAALRARPQGDGGLPNRTSSPAKLVDVLNKMKHQTAHCQNFKVLGQKHFMYISADKNGKPDCILEFEVNRVIDLCRIAEALL